ncbi:amidase [Novosphingobium tardum]|uniref:Amidase n=1 Tax=Novosphingobium tardum TaxID=1538021 RepID=A0ABV8RRA4_9SPHN
MSRAAFPFVFILAALLGGAPAQADEAAARAAAAYLKRIAAIDDKGPAIHAVIAINPAAVAEARAATGLLAGRSVLVKDNIETRELPTTAGSLALAGNVTGRDAPLVARMRAAGGVVLGKTNLSEWANIRSPWSASGWSAVGGQTRNPYALDRTPCGSSSGSGAAVAAGMAWAAIGTETDGSITCPSSVNGLVGFKPTVGLVSRTYVVPISHSQDTPGPMAKSVADAALLLNAISGSDPLDAQTVDADSRKSDFTAGLATSSLKDVRIGVLRKQAGDEPKTLRVFETALADLRRAGAVLVDIDYDFPRAMGKGENEVLQYELRENLGAYLRDLPGTAAVRSLADVIGFNKANPAELAFFGQETFEKSALATDASAYSAARVTSLTLAGIAGIDRLLGSNQVSFLIAPTEGPAWPIDHVMGERGLSGVGAGSLAAIAGYPHLTVPMGAVEGLPVGLSFIGPKWADAAVLDAGAAYERARSAKLPVPTLKRWSE